MSEYINGINITTPDGSIKQLRFGGNEPVVEYLGGSGNDISEWIKEIYIAGATSPYSNEITINFMTTNVIQITLSDGNTKTDSSDNGFYEFNFNSGILYMYVDTSKTVSNATGSIRIINLRKCINISQSPTISLYLKINDLEEKIKTSEEKINDLEELIKTLEEKINNLEESITPTE